jgi:hypothetical protein
MAAPLSATKREELWSVWQSCQSVRGTARICRVSHVTVGRYRKLDGWDKRLEKIHQDAMAKADRGEVDRRARHIKLAKKLQDKGEEFLDRRKINDEHGAIRAIETGVKIEREAEGEAGETTKTIVEIRFAEPK